MQWAADQHLPDQEAFVEKFNAVSVVNRVSIDDGLTESRLRSQASRRRGQLISRLIHDVVADPVVVVGSSDLQSRYPLGSGKESEIGLIAIILVGEQIAGVDVRPYGVRGSV